jgi:hypothetical protein
LPAQDKTFLIKRNNPKVRFGDVLERRGRNKKK